MSIEFFREICTPLAGNSDEDFAELTERANLIPAPYMARNKWIMVKKDFCTK